MQQRFDASLGTIRCEATQDAIDSVLFECGLHTQQASTPHHFDIRNSARGNGPEIDLDLWQLALMRLRHAERHGRLPPFSIERERAN